MRPWDYGAAIADGAVVFERNSSARRNEVRDYF